MPLVENSNIGDRVTVCRSMLQSLLSLGGIGSAPLNSPCMRIFECYFLKNSRISMDGMLKLPINITFRIFPFQ